MSWVNALALGGLALVALPVLIHMMGRAPSRVLRFPSLRFLEASRLLPSKRTRIQDPLLMVLRALVLACAALALAGPVFNGSPSGTEPSLRAIAVVLDTSVSVQRGGGLVRGREIADSIAREATSSAVIAVARLADAVDPAAAWLSTQQGAREIALVSDFQLGAIDPADLARLPAGTHVSVTRIPLLAPSGERIVRTSQGGADVAAQVHTTGNASQVTWARAMRAERSSSRPFEVLTGPGEVNDVVLVGRAAQVVGSAVTSDTARKVALVYPNYPGREALLRTSSPLQHPWQGEVVSRLAAYSSSIARRLAASSLVSNHDRLLIFTDVPLVSGPSVELHAALTRAVAGPLQASELEPRQIDDRALAAIAAITTGPAPDPAAAAPTESAARRWFWIAALILLGAEWLLRRAPRASDA